jgi:glycosyltransferase involved in cell wall biosynthesis
MSNPLFSVVIPTYNCAAYLQQSIESALWQSISSDKREIIVVDDGSTDETPQLVARFGNAVRYVRQENGGVSAARNAGIALARGRYVAFLDADDYWFAPRLQLAEEMFGRSNGVFLATDFFLERSGRIDAGSYYAAPGRKALFELEPEAQMEFAVEDNFINYMTIVPREAVISAGGFDTALRYGEDWHLWLRLLQGGLAVRLIDTPCAVYRMRRPGAATANATYAMARDRVRVLESYPGFVSPYRRQRAHGLLDHYGLIEAIAHKQLGPAIAHAGALARNWAYVREVIGEHFHVS